MAVPLSSNQGTFIEVFTKPRATSPVAWWALVGTSAVQIVPGGAGRAGVLFHNPGSSNLFFLPGLVDGNGNPIFAGSNNGAGSLVVTPGQFVYIGQDSPVGNAIWVAALSGINNPATVWEFI